MGTEINFNYVQKNGSRGCPKILNRDCGQCRVLDILEAFDQQLGAEECK